MNGGFLVIIVLGFLLLWVFVLRPQKRRQTSQSEMQETLEVGDEIITAGGMYGTIETLLDDRLEIEIAPGTRVRIDRRAVAAVVEADDERADAAEEHAAGADAASAPLS